MTERSLKQMQLLLKSLDGGSWSRLEPFHLSVFRSLHARRINYPFLHVLAEFWDSQKHVFRFNNVELCPLPEEFAAILGSQLDSARQIVIPSVGSPDLHFMQYQMARMFNLPPQSSLQHILGTDLLMDSLLEAMTAMDNTEMCRSRMLAFCLYAQFLLVSTSGECDSKILNVLDQVEAGSNPFPLILAETIIGLDNFAERRRFSGSPMLLEVSSLSFKFSIIDLSTILYRLYSQLSQAWFHEKLRLLEPPRDIIHYRAKHCRTRRLQPIPGDVRSWLATFPDTLIHWMCPWWRLEHVTVRSYTYCVPVAGLHFAIFYNPARLCRQYGQKQMIPELVHEFESGPLTQNFLDNLVMTWPRRTILRCIDHDGDSSTDDQYKEWVQLQQVEKDEFKVGKRTRELQRLSVQQKKRK